MTSSTSSRRWTWFCAELLIFYQMQCLSTHQFENGHLHFSVNTLFLLFLVGNSIKKYFLWSSCVILLCTHSLWCLFVCFCYFCCFVLSVQTTTPTLVCKYSEFSYLECSYHLRHGTYFDGLAQELVSLDVFCDDLCCCCFFLTKCSAKAPTNFKIDPSIFSVSTLLLQFLIGTFIRSIMLRSTLGSHFYTQCRSSICLFVFLFVFVVVGLFCRWRKRLWH